MSEAGESSTPPDDPREAPRGAARGRAIAAAIAVATAMGLAVAGLAVVPLFQPGDPAGATRVFSIERGEAFPSVARRLGAEGLLPRSPLFGPRILVWYARLRGVDRRIKSGEYDLSPQRSPSQLLAKLVSGEVKTYAVTLIPGLRMDEIAVRLGEAEILESAAFLRAASDPALAAELGVEGDTLEGYLYPDTYRFRRGTSPEEVAQRLIAEFWGHFTDDDRQRVERDDLTLHEIVTLASLVEKETGATEERPLIAAVFRNRLERRMRLQSDPTVIYGVIRERGTFDGDIRWRDLREDTPYNTYTRGGIPPGPISSVTIDSIRAVLEPADVPFLYFVSRNDGTHQFSRTLRDHSRAVEQYQRRRSSRHADPS